MTNLILTEQHDRVLVVRINRPERKNALTHAMYDGLADALMEAEQDSAIRCTLFTGNTDCFTAGNDLSDFADGLPGDFEETPVGRFLFGLANASKPVVAAVNGPAVGIGTTMLMHCDLVFAGDNARFQMPFANLGLCPEGGSSLLLPQWLGRVRASELLMLGTRFSAEDADRLGLINRICPPDSTETTALEVCQQLASQPPAAIRATKQLINRATSERLNATMQAEGRLFADRLQSPEAAEAFAAFAEKRTPDFSSFE
ncbi:enoyl-CoA hydratase/carnithine racemase [Tamilnaduibacter salinus]|uniref:Enoyl-CoA hydratase n=1 Tax=Tamilnaduibacter salinus TaxID=1484056 RepID=A0A2A2I800_9GAMM|nr:enoyl-CoA hydratase [Tamilnaduibacter salinus]PAV27424.1 enoyl-CoA hydratase [Tamilnaduibacter salinus]PVY75467.1 enoyl-CoA hydratase/carnithine racemase [Tamilnaduibacter salinus]